MPQAIYKHQPVDRIPDDLARRGTGALVRGIAIVMDRALQRFQADSESTVTFTTISSFPDALDFFYLPGRSGGQTAYGGTAASDTLRLRSTSHATKGKIIFGAAGTSAYDEVNERWGFGTASPGVQVHATGSLRAERIGIDGAATVARSLALFDADASAAVSLVAHATTTAYTLVLPAAQGAANSILVNDGSGNLSTTVSPRFTAVGIGGAAGAARTLSLFDSDGSDAVTIVAHATTTGYALVLPPAQALGANDALLNDGSGNLSFGAVGDLRSDSDPAATSGSWSFNSNSTDKWPTFRTDANTAVDGKWAQVSDDIQAGSLSFFFSSPEGRLQTYSDVSGAFVMRGDGADPPASGFMGKVDRTAQVANIATTNLSDAAGAGCYMVEAFMECTTGAGAAGTLALTIGWTDDVGATTSTPITAFTLAVTGRTSGRQFLYSTAGTITYAVAITGIYSTAAYALRIRVTYLG